MTSLRPLLIPLALCLAAPALLWAQAPAATEAAPPADPYPLTRGIDRANFNEEIAACDDFFAYSNDGWISRNPIPPDQTGWGTWVLLQERNAVQLRELMEAAKGSAAATGSPQRQVGDFYAAASDAALAKSLGAEPIWPLLAKVDALDSTEALLTYIAQSHREGQFVGFSVGVNPDFKDPSKTFLYVVQGGLGLPDRDDYARTDSATTNLRWLYRGHISRTLELAGLSKIGAATVADSVIAIETRLANASLPRVALREPGNRYAPISLDKAQKLTPAINWSHYFQTLGLDQVESFSLPSSGFFQEFDRMLGEVPLAQWQDYLRWHIVRTSAPYLSEGFVESDFLFYESRLRGRTQQRDRWKRAVEVTSQSLGEPVGELYVAKHFPPESKAAALELIGDLRAALKERLEKLDWMSPQTRKRALEKLATFTPKIGYPDQWRDYSGLEIKPDDLIGNLRRAAAFEQARQLAKLGKPTDRSEWRMSPQTINAYYNALQNEIVFPAAILQPPFFDPEADAAVNYGAIGAVIGHELLHGFDDKGSQYDQLGRWDNWWTKQDRKLFDERTAKLAKQYDAYVVEGLNVNGQLTLGENIADLGGVTVAFDALQRRLERDPAQDIDGLTANQRFFLAWSQIWRRHLSKAAAQLQSRTDPHSPPRHRVNGPLLNVPEFAKAFSCKAGDAMVADKKTRVVIW